MARLVPRALTALAALYSATTTAAMRSAPSSEDSVVIRRSAAPADAGKVATGGASSAAPADAGQVTTGWASSGAAAHAGKVATGWASGAASADAGEIATGEARGPVIATATVLPRRLARVLRDRVKEEGTAQITAMGPVASYVALKAVIIAGKGLRKSFPGKVLAVVPSRREFMMKGGTSMVGYLLDVRAVPARGAKKPVALIDGDVDARFLPGFMSRRMKKQGSVTLGAVGAKAVYRVVKASVDAQRILAQDEAGKAQLALVPGFTKFERRGKKIARMHLACVRTSA